MKAFIFLNIIFVLLYLIGFAELLLKKGKTTPSDRFMSRNYTERMKGIAILTVFWGHGAAWCGVNNLQFIAGTGVAIFLILSGYGLEKSYEKNGLKWFWIKRFTRVILPFWIVEFVYEFIHKDYSLKEFSFSVFLKNGLLLGEAGWYVIYILICYINYYLIKCASNLNWKIFKNTTKEQIDLAECIMILTVFTGFLIYEMINPYNGEVFYLRTRQMYCFPLGFIIAKYYEKVRKYIEKCKKRTFIYMIISGIIGLGFMGVTQMDLVKSNRLISDFSYMPTVIMLAISIMLLVYLMPVFVKSYFICFCGMISYEIFLIHSKLLNYVSGDSRWSIVWYVVKTFAFSILLYLITNSGKIVKMLRSRNVVKR